MRNDNVRQIITDNVAGKSLWIKMSAFLAFGIVIGMGLMAALFLQNMDRFSNDELAQFAELAACSTGEPASTLWMSAHERNGWFIGSQVETVRRFLVDIDINRCRIRETANAHTDDGEIWAFSPDNRKN